MDAPRLLGNRFGQVRLHNKAKEQMFLIFSKKKYHTMDFHHIFAEKIRSQTWDRIFFALDRQIHLEMSPKLLRGNVRLFFSQ